jgi:hypothetical protein
LIIGFVALEDELVSCGCADILVVHRFINPIAKVNETPTTLKINAVNKGYFFTFAKKQSKKESVLI